MHNLDEPQMITKHADQTLLLRRFVADVYLMLNGRPPREPLTRERCDAARGALREIEKCKEEIEELRH